MLAATFFALTFAFLLRRSGMSRRVAIHRFETPKGGLPMKRSTVVTFTACAIALLALAGAPPALATQDTNTTFPIAGVVVNGCNGELVDITGEAHQRVHITADGSGGFHVSTS